MALQKLAIAIFAYYAAIAIQGCGSDSDDETTVTKATTPTPAPTAAAPATTPAPTTAAPTPAPTMAPVEMISGSFSFTMTAAAAADVAAAFQDESKKDKVSEAFAGSIADGITGVAAEDVQINGISAVRRLASAGRSLTTASLQVDYMITTTVADIATKITTVDTTAVSAAVETGLKAVPGLEAVAVTGMETPAAPMAQPKCMAQFMKVSMEMQKSEKAGQMTSNGLCDGFEGFATHCKETEYDGLANKPSDDDGDIKFETIMNMKDQKCSPCGKGWMMLSKKMNDGRRLSGHASGPTQAQCDEMDKFIADCPDKAAFDELKIECGHGHHGGGNTHNHRALGGHNAGTTANQGSGYGYGYGMMETTTAAPTPTPPQEGCYAGPACVDAFNAGLRDSPHGCCDCTRFGPRNEQECEALSGATWFDGIENDCAGMCIDGPAIIGGEQKMAGCYGGPLCKSTFAEGHDWMPIPHGCCDCSHDMARNAEGELLVKEVCLAETGSRNWFPGCGVNYCIPDWRIHGIEMYESGPKCDHGVLTYDNVMATIDEMKKGCGGA